MSKEEERLLAAASPFLSTTDTLAIRKEVSAVCFVTRLVDYDNFTKSCDLQALANIMDRYYDSVATILTEKGGVVDRFCEDHIVASFGMLAVERTHVSEIARAALDAARRICDTEARANWGSVAIGICYGTLIYGQFGAARRATVTAFGPSLICAHRSSLGQRGIRTCERLRSVVQLDVVDLQLANHWGPS